MGGVGLPQADDLRDLAAPGTSKAVAKLLVEAREILAKKLRLANNREPRMFNLGLWPASSLLFAGIDQAVASAVLARLRCELLRKGYVITSGDWIKW